MDYSFIRENFDINNITKSILSIQISLDGFSFVISPSDSHTIVDYIYIKRIESQNNHRLIEELTSFNGFDQKEFYSIRIIVHETNFTLVPDTIFDLKDMKTYLKLNHPPRSKSKNISHRIPAAKAVCVFSMEESLLDILKNKFPGADFYHTSLPLSSSAINKNLQGCYIQCFEKTVEVVVVRDQKLVFYNVFELQNENDLVYYVLSVYKSTGLDPHLHPLFISGILPGTSASIELAGKYVKDIQFYIPEGILFPEQGEPQFPTHYFINHKEILNCEL